MERKDWRVVAEKHLQPKSWVSCQPLQRLILLICRKTISSRILEPKTIRKVQYRSCLRFCKYSRYTVKFSLLLPYQKLSESGATPNSRHSSTDLT